MRRRHSGRGTRVCSGVIRGSRSRYGRRVTIVLMCEEEQWRKWDRDEWK